MAWESQPGQNSLAIATQDSEPAILDPTSSQASAIPSQAPATDNSKLAHVLVQIASQQGRLPAHQQIAVLDQLCQLADGDFSKTRAVLEPALVLNRCVCPKGAKNKPKRKAPQHETSM